MSSPDELRICAVDCGRLARSAKDPHDKARLLNMARAWAELADRIERIGQGVPGRTANGPSAEWGGPQQADPEEREAKKEQPAP